MRVSEAIKQADALRDNTLTDSVKAAWVYDIEGRVAEIVSAEIPANVWPETDAELLMPYPYDNIYPLYLTAMIDYYNGESQLYFNDYTVYNAAMAEAQAWWIRHNRPKDGNYWRVM